VAHQHSDDIASKLKHLRDIRRSALPLRSDHEAMLLLLSTQDAFHALACARDGSDKVAGEQLLQS